MTFFPIDQPYRYSILNILRICNHTDTATVPERFKTSNGCHELHSIIRSMDFSQTDHEIEWYWVRGHSGCAENERVDRLARAAATRGVSTAT